METAFSESGRRPGERVDGRIPNPGIHGITKRDRDARRSLRRPKWTAGVSKPSFIIRLPAPISFMRSTVLCSRTPALMMASTSLQLFLSRTPDRRCADDAHQQEAMAVAAVTSSTVPDLFGRPTPR
jgi:hypothetical protein